MPPRTMPRTIEMPITTTVRLRVVSRSGQVIFFSSARVSSNKPRRRPVRWVTARDIDRDDVPLEQTGLEPEAIVQPQSTLQHVLNLMLDSSHGAALVVDGDGAYLGAVDFATVATAIQAMRREDRDELRAAADAFRQAERTAVS